MPGGFFGRMARKWWLMLVVGIVIGLAAGLPAGGRIMPGGGKLLGTAESDYFVYRAFPQKTQRCAVVDEFEIGELILLPINKEIEDSVICNGAILNAHEQHARYIALTIVLGNAYGGDGRNTVGIPDLTNKPLTGLNYHMRYWEAHLNDYNVGDKSITRNGDVKYCTSTLPRTGCAGKLSWQPNCTLPVGVNI